MKRGVISKISLLVIVSLFTIGCLAACGSQPQNIITSVQKAEAVANNGGAKLTLTLPAQDFANANVKLANFPDCVIDGTAYSAVDGASADTGLTITYDITTMPSANSSITFSNDKTVVYSSVDTKTIMDALSASQSSGSGGISIPTTPRSTSLGGLADSSASTASSAQSSAASASTTSDTSAASSSAAAPLGSESADASAASVDTSAQVNDNVKGSVIRKCQSMFDVFYNLTPAIELDTITAVGTGSYHAVGRYSSDSKNGSVEVDFNDDAQLSSLKVDGKELLAV